jgi:hypothetical protein
LETSVKKHLFLIMREMPFNIKSMAKELLANLMDLAAKDLA